MRCPASSLCANAGGEHNGRDNAERRHGENSYHRGLRVAVSFVVPVIAFVLLYVGFIFMRTASPQAPSWCGRAHRRVFGVWLIYIASICW